MLCSDVLHFYCPGTRRMTAPCSDQTTSHDRDSTSHYDRVLLVPFSDRLKATIRRVGGRAGGPAPIANSEGTVRSTFSDRSWLRRLD